MYLFRSLLSKQLTLAKKPKKTLLCIMKYILYYNLQSPAHASPFWYALNSLGVKLMNSYSNHPTFKKGTENIFYLPKNNKIRAEPRDY